MNFVTERKCCFKRNIPFFQISESFCYCLASALLFVPQSVNRTCYVKYDALAATKTIFCWAWFSLKRTYREKFYFFSSKR